MALSAVAGQKIFIGNAPMDDQADDFVASDFAAVTWTEIDGWTNAGSFGDTNNLITTPLINRSRDTKQKGTANAGQMQNTFAINSTDPGQILLYTANASKRNYPFKIENNDLPSGPPSPTPQPSKRYFVGLVMSTEEAGGGANTVQSLNATVEINSNIVRVAKVGT